MTKFPLAWPVGWRRTNYRRSAKFNTKERGTFGARSLTVAEGVHRVLKTLELMGIREGNAVISSNVPVRLDGLPRSDQGNPGDSGVAVYWIKPGWKTHKVMAIDQYTKVQDNLAAVAATLEAMRAIERHGGAMILERAFVGFDQLPAPMQWREILGFNEQTPPVEVARQRMRELSKVRHPDTGGSEALFQELMRAWSDCQRELRVHD